MARGEPRDPSRRSLLMGLATAGAAASVTSMAVSDARAEALHREALTDESVRAFLGPIGPGALLAGRWRVEAVRGVRFGSVSLLLSTRDGASFQVDVLRRDASVGAPRGVGESETLAVFLSNRGDGSTATDEEMGLGAMAVADALRERERAGAASPALLTLSQRSARYPDGALAVLRG